METAAQHNWTRDWALTASISAAYTYAPWGFAAWGLNNYKHLNKIKMWNKSPMPQAAEARFMLPTYTTKPHNSSIAKKGTIEFFV